MNELQLAPDCHNYKEFSKQGRCPLTDVCNDDCIFVWKKCYEAMNENSAKISKYEDLIDEIEYLRDENASLESDNDELYWKKDEIENQYKQMITDLAILINDESFEKLKELNLEGKVSSWFDDLESERNCLKIKSKDKIIDIEGK